MSVASEVIVVLGQMAVIGRNTQASANWRQMPARLSSSIGRK
jgi:hypothetical protein